MNDTYLTVPYASENQLRQYPGYFGYPGYQMTYVFTHGTPIIYNPYGAVPLSPTGVIGHPGIPAAGVHGFAGGHGFAGAVGGFRNEGNCSQFCGL
ncbi:hypothetical protein [Bacillus sonorensis]|uniref:hypothetical protein n=1 Tax=Bacillus sonorensis TaxID=119858 RepID=UPI0004952931|nr:hypothetical protein [Bacillus sonorensis]MEC1590795.1 hypothetical protein [Bacillus sonorensis]